jgi:7-cyano-7-deazaguanine synthase
MRAIVLLSGGLDSATVAAMAKAKGWTLDALTIRYGQVHAIEMEAARRVARAVGVDRHVELEIDLAALGGSTLVGDGTVPKGRDLDEGGIPSTYVPARNTVFLSLALAFAETRGAERIALGVNAIDYSGYPDCRPEFLAAFEHLARLATRAGVEGGEIKIYAPLIKMTKADIIREGMRLGVDYGLTHSCYDPLPEGHPCGECDSCRLRARGFADAGIKDPLLNK